LSSIVCFEDRCESEEERRARELEVKLKQHVEAKLEELLKTLVERYEIEVTVDLRSGRGVARWRRK
jgi:hypothetical protein